VIDGAYPRALSARRLVAQTRAAARRIDGQGLTDTVVVEVRSGVMRGADRRAVVPLLATFAPGSRACCSRIDSIARPTCTRCRTHRAARRLRESCGYDPGLW